MKELFTNEKILSEFDDKSIILTSLRISKTTKELGNSFHQSVMLEHVTSCENTNTYTIAYIVIAAIFLGFGIFYGINDQGNYFAICGIVCCIFIIMFFVTRDNIILISSPSTKMKIRISGMKNQKALDFINSIEHAIANRIL